MRKGYATQGAVQPGPVFLEDAKGNRYDVAGNIVPPAQDPVTDALSVARREVVDPYAEEIASAKKLMADQAYQDQSWSDWASDVGQNLYNTGMAFLPTALGGQGAVGISDIAKGAYESAKSGATLPGDVLTGKTKVFDPTSGDLTEEVLRRGADFTGFVTLGAGAIPAEANTLRMGMKGPSVPDDPEAAALKAAQEATGTDQPALAAKTAGQQLADDQMEAMQPPSMPVNVSPDAPTKAFVQFGKPIPPSAPPPDPALLQQAQADTRMGADIVKRRLPVIVPEQERVIGGVYTPGTPDGRRWSELTPQELSIRGKGAGFTNDDLQGIWNQTLSEVSEAGRQAVANTGATWKAFPAEKWDKALKLPLRSQLWYELSGEAFVDRLPDLKYNEHMMFLDLVGATSARARPGENLERALAVLSQRLRGVPIDVDLTTPSTVSAALRRDGKNVSSDLANKTGMFSDTLALTGGLPTRYPISVNDVWVGNAFGITDDQLSANQALHEVFGKYTNKLRDLVNKTSPSPYPHQSWNLQSRQWVELRAADEGVDTSIGSTIEGSDYAGEWGKVLRKLQSAGIDVPNGEITRDILMDPRFADALRSTTPGFRSAPKATIEFGTLLTPNGQKAADIYNRARQLGDQKTQDEYLVALTTSMYHTARGKKTIWDETVRSALGKKVNVSRIYSPKQEDPFAISGTFGGAAAPNIRVPLRGLTPDEVAYFNAVAGKGLRQKAMAAVEINRLEAGQPIPEGAVPSHAVQFEYDGPIPQKMLTDFAAALGEGFEVSAVRYPDSMVVDINPRFGDAGPEAADPQAIASAIKLLEDQYGIKNAKAHDISYKSEYGKNYVEDPGDGSGYRQIINATLKGWEAEAVAQLRNITGGRFSDAVLKKYLKGDNEALKSAAAASGSGVSVFAGRANTVRENLRKRLSDHADVTKKWNAIGKEIDKELGALIPKWERRYTKAEKKSIKEAPQRAIEQGFTTEAYRGSNRDIQEYGPRASESGYYGGKPTYFTSSPEDATGYTRVPLEEYEVSPYDQLKVLQETNPEATLQDVLGGKYPGLAEEYVNRLSGGENLGAVYPSKLKMQNPVRVGGGGETFFKGEEAANLVKTTANTLAEAGVSPETALPILSKLDDMLQSGGFGAMDFDLAVRNAAKGADKRLLTKIGSILADIYQKSGFDSIDLDASVFSSRRAGSYSYPAPEGSRHYMVFDPENIRGRFAKFGGYGPEGPAYMKAMGGAVDDEDIDNALRLARAMGGRIGYAEAGSVPVMMEDAKGNKYDAQGNIIPPTNPTGSSHISDPTLERKGMIDVGEPANYETEVKPFIDVATSPMNWAVESPDSYSGFPLGIGTVQTEGPSLLDTMKIATQLAASGQPTEDRGEYNWGQSREKAVRRFVGAPEGGEEAPYRGPFSYNPSDTANYLNTLIGFSPVGWAELFHDIPYEAGRTGDYGTAAYEGGINAALSAPGIAALGLAGRAGINALRRNPKLAAGLIGSTAFVDPNEAEAGPARWFSKAMEVARAIPMEKMTGQQALAMLRKGVSPEELKWTGADVFLPQQKQITKQDLVDYLAKNRVQTSEIVLGGGAKPTRREDVIIDSDILAKYEPLIKDLQGQQNIAEKEFRRLRSEGAPYSEQSRIESEEMRLASEIGQIRNKMIDEQINKIGGLGQPSKFGPESGYGETLTTPGGKSYRENLFAIPPRDIFTPFVEQMRKDVWSETYKEALSNGFSEERAKAFADKFNNLKPGELAKFLGKEEELASIFEAQRSLKQEAYTGGHWGEYPGVIAHTRTNELLYEPPGANRPYRVHNVEETQSDPGQAGRKHGFKDQQAMAAVARLRQETQELKAVLKYQQEKLYREHQERIAPYTEERVRYERELREKYKRGEISLGDMNRAAEAYPSPEQELTGQYRAATYETLNPIMDKIAANEAEINRIGGKIGPIPMMPYVTSTEGWTDFAIKKEIDRALDSGADYFSWTPGDVHAERYDLSKHISKVQYNPDDGSLLAYDPKGKMVVNESVNDPDDLDEYLGKELADKMRLEAESRRSSIDEYDIGKDDETGEWYISLYGEPIEETFPSKGHAKDYLNKMMANELANNPVELSGLDLKVGGEGMRGYYDKIYLKRVQDVIKKSTGIKPEIETITVNTADGPRQQFGVRITDEIREKARFSDFNKGGRVTNKANYADSPDVSRALALTRD